jgi:hypothetical protein
LAHPNQFAHVCGSSGVRGDDNSTYLSMSMARGVNLVPMTMSGALLLLLVFEGCCL